jgi:hypothetical protein
VTRYTAISIAKILSDIDYLTTNAKLAIALDFGEAIEKETPRITRDEFVRLVGFVRTDRPKPERKRKARKN